MKKDMCKIYTEDNVYEPVSIDFESGKVEIICHSFNKVRITLNKDEYKISYNTYYRDNYHNNIFTGDICTAYTNDFKKLYKQKFDIEYVDKEIKLTVYENAYNELEVLDFITGKTFKLQEISNMLIIKNNIFASNAEAKAHRETIDKLNDIIESVKNLYLYTSKSCVDLIDHVHRKLSNIPEVKKIMDYK